MRARDGEDGVVGGAEVLAFGFLVFVVGTLLAANAWAVVDAKLAATAAAREAARAFVEAPHSGAAGGAAAAAFAATLAGHGRDAARGSLHVDGVFARCARVRATVSYVVAPVRLPWVGGLGPFTVRAAHSEIVDPYRSGLDRGAVAGGGCVVAG